MNPPTKQLSALLARATSLLLDFDGPVCHFFAGYPAADIAEHLRKVIAAYGATLPRPAPDDDGPIQVLWTVADLGDAKLTHHAADALRDAEIQAAAGAAPTPGAAEVLHAARAGGRRVAVVSNNYGEAVRAYLDAHDLSQYVDHVVARYDGMEPRLLKPDPHLVRLALDDLAAPPAAALFVGDSTGDIQAGRAAGVPNLGYANKPGKRQALLDAGADAVIDTMTELAHALSIAPQPS